MGKAEQLSKGSKVLILNGEVSPDGKWIAYHDKNQELWLLNVADRKSSKVASNDWESYRDLRWSPHSKWLAYVEPTETFLRIHVYSVKDGKSYAVTTERADSSSPAWSPDGRWLYFLSDRSYKTVVPAPWGGRQPEPFFDKQTRIFLIALRKGERSPWQPEDELSPREPEKKKDEKKGVPDVHIDLDGIDCRLYEVPVAPGNWDTLSVSDKRLFLLDSEVAVQPKKRLAEIDIARKDVAVKNSGR